MNLYGIFWNELTHHTAECTEANDRSPRELCTCPKPMWCMSRRKRDAIAKAKAMNGYVGVIRHAYGYGSPQSWDAPTFRVTMDLVADYRRTPIDKQTAYSTDQQFTVGDRVELSPGCDLWVRGAKYGTVTAIRKGLIMVRMDHKQVRKLIRTTPTLLRHIR